MSRACDRSLLSARVIVAAIFPVAILAFCILTSAQSLQPRPNAAVFTGAYIIAGLAWVGAGWLESRRPGTYSLLWIVALGTGLRAILLPFGPLFDNDIYRYLWDGHVAAHGINPLLHAPASEQLAALRTCYYGQIGFPEIGTIYPPFAQLVFLAAAKCHLTTPALFKLILIPFDIGTMALIVALLKRLGKPTGPLLLYAWSPLILKEIFNSCHIDIVMMSLMLLAIYMVFVSRPALGGMALALSVMTKGVSILALPLLAKRRWSQISVPFLVAALALCLPYFSAGTKALDGAAAYAHYWRFNDGFFYLLYKAEQAFRLHEEPTAPYAKVAAVAMLLAYLVCLVRRMDRALAAWLWRMPV